MIPSRTAYIRTYSSPAFGSDQSPCRVAVVAENVLLADDDRDIWRITQFLLVSFRAPGGAKGHGSWSHGIVAWDAALLCRNEDMEVGFRMHWKVLLVSPAILLVAILEVAMMCSWVSVIEKTEIDSEVGRAIEMA